MTITTITVEDNTKSRLLGYKHGSWTYDDVLNLLMDKVPLEDISEEHIREHNERLKDFRGISKEQFKKRIRKRLNRSG